MSVLSEQGPTNPQDPSHYAPRKPSERTELRLSTIGATVGETAFDRSSIPAGAGRSLRQSAPLNADLENAVYESLRRKMDPEVVPEPAGFRNERSRRRGLLAVAGGIAAAVGVSAGVALLFVNVVPGSRESNAGPSFLARAASSALSQEREDDGSKPALAQFRSLLATNEGDQPSAHEQSERLLEQFMQWRQKADAAGKRR